MEGSGDSDAASDIVAVIATVFVCGAVQNAAPGQDRSDGPRAFSLATALAWLVRC